MMTKDKKPKNPDKRQKRDIQYLIELHYIRTQENWDDMVYQYAERNNISEKRAKRWFFGEV